MMRCVDYNLVIAMFSEFSKVLNTFEDLCFDYRTLCDAITVAEAKGREKSSIEVGGKVGRKKATRQTSLAIKAGEAGLHRCLPFKHATNIL